MQAKAERIERQRDDPYYVGPVARADSDVDVDSIPVVQLSLDFVPPRAGRAPPPRAPTPPPVHIDIDGEMPDGADFDIPPPVVEPIVEIPVEVEPVEVVESQATESAVLKVTKKKKRDPSKPKKKKEVALD